MTKPALRRETDVVLFRNDANWSTLMHLGIVGFCSFSEKDSERNAKKRACRRIIVQGQRAAFIQKLNKQKKNRLFRSGSLAG